MVFDSKGVDGHLSVTVTTPVDQAQDTKNAIVCAPVQTCFGGVSFVRSDVNDLALCLPANLATLASPASSSAKSLRAKRRAADTGGPSSASYTSGLHLPKLREVWSRISGGGVEKIPPSLRRP